MAGLSVYDGILSPNGGLYKPGPEVVMPGGGELTSRAVKTVPIDPVTGMPTDALAQLLIAGSGRGSGGASSGSGGAMGLAAPNQPNGSLVANKDMSRLPIEPIGYGPEPDMGSAEAAIAAAVPRNMFEGYRSEFRPVPLRREADAGDGGLFGIPMSPGMERILAQGQNRQAGPWGSGSAPPGAEATTQAIATALIGSRPSVAPAVAAQQARGLNPNDAYYAAIAAEKARAIQNSSNPSANSARASLASQWGFD